MSFAPLLRRRLAFVRLLLLALCLNATLGVALHAAEHLGEGTALSVPAARDGAAGREEPAEAGAEPCAWCLAHAHAEQLAGPAPTRPAAAQAPRPPGAAMPAPFVPVPAHWRFASRDPPPRAG